VSATAADEVEARIVEQIGRHEVSEREREGDDAERHNAAPWPTCIARRKHRR
jgi:hypothetical protein